MSIITVKENEAYWDDFYKQDFVHIPSQFCALVATDIKPHSVVVDLGCGNGRDSHFFASANFSVVGVDLSYGAIEACRAQSRPNQDLQFVCGDISNEDTCKEITELLARKKADKSIFFYSRFVMHSLDEEQEESFMLSLKHLMVNGDCIYFEFRSKEDQLTKKIYENHFRRYIDTSLFIKKLIEIVDVEVLYSITGRGMAMYKGEDPSVSRIIARKR